MCTHREEVKVCSGRSELPMCTNNLSTSVHLSPGDSRHSTPSSSSCRRCFAFLLCAAESFRTERTSQKHSFRSKRGDFIACSFEFDSARWLNLRLQSRSEGRFGINKILIHSFRPRGENGGSFVATRDGKLYIHSSADNARAATWMSGGSSVDLPPGDRHWAPVSGFLS